MNKVFLFLLLLFLTEITIAQSPRIDRVKKELNDHSENDTFRVNRLNELASNSFLEPNERTKYAKEALAISQKINYPKGQGFAYMLLGNIKISNGSLAESKPLLHLADSIANKTGDIELKANVLWRMALAETNPALRDSLLQVAYSLAIKTGNLELQSYVLYNIANATHDIIKAKSLFLQADSIAKKAAYPEWQANLESILGYKLMSSGDKDGMPYLLNAEEIAEKSGDKAALWKTQILIAQTYTTINSNYAKGMEYFLKALHSAEGSDKPRLLISAWTGMANIYSVLGDQDNALTYLLKADSASKGLGNNATEGNLQNSIGEMYRLLGKYPEAIKAYNKSIELATDKAAIETAESNLADVYVRMDSLRLAFQYAFTSRREAKEVNDIGGVSWIDGILSRAYLKKNMPDSAIYYGTDGLATAKETGTIEFMRDNALALANAYAYKKDFQKAYINHLLYVDYRDSMLNEEVRNKTSVEQYNFKLDKKEAQIIGLNAQKKYQRNLLIGTIVLLFLILASAVLLLRNNRLKQKANKLLHKQKQEIDEKATELSKQKENVELLSEIGRKVTSSLSVEKIISTAYANVNALMDANVFGIGIYNGASRRIEFPATYENGEQLPFYTNDVNDNNRFGSLCFNSKKEIIINDLEKEYKDHIQEVVTVDKTTTPLSLIYLPLIAKGEKLGVITVQSFNKNAYSDYQLFMLRNIATYAAIAIENAESYDALDKTLSSLKSTQSQLIQSEKMASLGELTAGIAHEIQNPLNFVNNFSEVNSELTDELKEELDKTNLSPEEKLPIEKIAEDIKINQQKISFHGKRADSIVKGMLQHSRSTNGQKEPTNINTLADEYLRLAYHGLRAKDKSFNATMKTEFDENIPKLNVVPQDIGRVILNLITNAFYAVTEKTKTAPSGYEPTVTVITKKSNHIISVIVKDNGDGVSQKVKDKIFQPFFTTKPTGQGTGLGLSLSYDIVKAHGGKLRMESKEGEGAQFIIELPA